MLESVLNLKLLVTGITKHQALSKWLQGTTNDISWRRAELTDTIRDKDYSESTTTLLIY